MHGFTRFIEETLAPPLLWFSQLKYIRIVQRTFIGFTSLLIIGSMFLLFATLPIDGYKTLLGPDVLGMIAKGSGVATSIIAVLVVVAASFSTTSYYNEIKHESNDILNPMLLSIASYLLILPAQAAQIVVEGADPTPFTGIPVQFLGAQGVFPALLFGIISTEAYRFFVRKKLTIKMPEGVPPMVAQAFAALIPSTIVILFWWMIKFVFTIDLPTLILGLFKPLVSAGDTPVSVIIATLLNRILWTAGIHGGTVVGSVAAPLWTDMNVANQAAFEAGTKLPYLFGGVFYDNYIWTGLAPVAFLLILSKSKRLRALGLLALPGTLFNIGEPIMFGLPIVMNPILIIPFVLSSLIIAILAIIGVTTGILPLPVLSVPWVTPAPIKIWMSSGGNGIMGPLFVIVTWLLTFVIYFAFIKIIEKQDLKAELEAGANK